jgi:hypothetical protein
MSNKRIKPPLVFPPEDKIRINWVGYFITFCEHHGEPVLSGGRLLFEDGWTYSSTDYAGPEFPPPTNNDELDVLIKEYWTVRQAQLTREVAKLIHERDKLRKISDSHSLPIQQTVKKEYNPSGYAPLNMSSLEQRIEWIQSDLIKCAKRLGEIEQYHKDKTNDGVSQEMA